MTFTEWVITHNNKKEDILLKIKDLSKKEQIQYFDYDNMIKKELNFCPLYKLNTKCHDIKDLNCFLCACPYFEYSDNTPLSVTKDINVMSRCSINAKEASSYTTKGIQQCDCSNCTVPHNKSLALKVFNGL